MANRFFAFAEYQADLMKDFFVKIVKACSRVRIGGLVHGGEAGEESFSNHLYYFLKGRTAGPGYEMKQRPSVFKLWRCTKPDLLSQLIREKIANNTLIFSQRGRENRTPLLLDRIRNADTDASLMEISELKALSHVIDDFDNDPWKPPGPYEIRL